MDDRNVGDVGDGYVRCELAVAIAVAVFAVCDVCSLLRLLLGLSVLLWLVPKAFLLIQVSPNDIRELSNLVLYSVTEMDGYVLLRPSRRGPPEGAQSCTGALRAIRRDAVASKILVAVAVHGRKHSVDRSPLVHSVASWGTAPNNKTNAENTQTLCHGGFCGFLHE